MSLDLNNGAEGRLTRSLRRNTEGVLETISSVQALDEIAQRLEAIVARHGPRSVGLYYGTAAYANSLATPLAKAFLHSLGSPNWFSTMTIDQSAAWVTMLRMGFMASGKPMPAEADTLLLIGNNPVVSHQMGGLYHPVKGLHEFRARGGRVIVVDPRATETARRADLHLPVRAGEDASLVAGLLRLVLESGRYDKAFCERHADGLQALQAALRPYTVEYVAQRTGIEQTLLLQTANAFIEARRPLAMAATGACMEPHSNLTCHLVECLALQL